MATALTIGPATAAAALKPRSTRSSKNAEELEEPSKEPKQRGHDGVDERCHRRGGPKEEEQRPLARYSQQGALGAEAAVT